MMSRALASGRSWSMVSILAWLALSIVVAWPIAVVAADIGVRAGAHEGYGRIVFDLPKRQAYKANIQGDELRVEFDGPVSASLTPVTRHLFRYVGKAEIEGDGRTIRLTLLKPVTLREQWIESDLVLDLVDEATQPAGTKAQVTVRSGDHPGFSRLVFDWRRHTDYRVESRDGGADILFTESARFDTAPVRADRPERLRSIVPLTPERGSGVRLDIDENARIRHFRSGNKVVVDVLGGKSEAKANATDQAKVEAAPETGQQPAADSEPEKSRPPRSLLSTPQIPAEKPRNSSASNSKRPVEGGTPSVAEKPRAVEPSAARSQSKAAYSSRSDKLEFTVDRSGDTIYLSFAWPEPVAAAAFERSGHLWLVFDRPGEVPLDRLSGDDGILQAQQIQDSRAMVLRLKVRNDRFPTLRRKGAVWLLSLSDRSGGAQTAIPAVSQPHAKGGGRIFLPATDSGKRLSVYDPEVGDELLVVPLLGDSVGVPVAQKFIQFELLASLQGIALRPISDDLRVKPLRNGIEIKATRGLTLSEPDSIQRTGSVEPYRASVKKPILHFVSWTGGRNAEFSARKKKLQSLLARAPAAGRNVARWELAKFYIGNGLASEALAMVTLIEKDDPGAAIDPQFRAVRGVANLLLGRLEPAREDLMHSDLNLYPDVALWRGDLMMQLANSDEARKQFALGTSLVPVLAELPIRLRERIVRHWALTAVQSGDEPSFKQAERELKRLPPNKRIKATLAYINGHRAVLAGDDAKALAAFDKAIAADYRPLRARAAFQKINAALRQGEISNDEAVERLDALRFAWRGDGFELDITDRVVELELEQKKYGDALNHLREAISYFPESPETKEMASLMNRIFVDLFLHGSADEMSPVSALALYYEFQELTPLGSDGDVMIQRLADRLASIDLLGRAAKLLDHQVTYRLQGREKARIGARLAVIYLLDAQPEKAREVLERTAAPNLPGALETERRYLHARALAELGRADDALALLGQDDSGAAELLRADIFWRDQRWADAATTAQAVLGERWRGEQPLTPREQTQVVQIAVSLYMSDDIGKLRDLQERYGGKMADGPYSETFRLLTQRVDLSKTEFRMLAGEIARTAELEAFMTSYRDRVKSGGLSALN